MEPNAEETKEIPVVEKEVIFVTIAKKFEPMAVLDTQRGRSIN